jgi:AcrR family transcriptional regulator
MVSGKPGRPPEDRLLRQREIYQAVAPLLLSVGARRLTMRQAARAACLSLGGLYHYFPTKQELVLHGVQPAAWARLCLDFHAVHGWRKQAEPRRFLELWTDFVIDWVGFVRPSVQAALELGQDTFWQALENGIHAGLEDLAQTLDLLVPTSDPEAARVLARRLQRSLFAACVDRALVPEELRDELLAALDEYRARLEPQAGAMRTAQTLYSGMPLGS